MIIVRFLSITYSSRRVYNHSVLLSAVPNKCWYKGAQYECGLSLSCVFSGAKALDLCNGGMVWSCCVPKHIAEPAKTDYGPDPEYFDPNEVRGDIYEDFPPTDTKFNFGSVHPTRPPRPDRPKRVEYTRPPRIPPAIEHHHPESGGGSNGLSFFGSDFDHFDHHEESVEHYDEEFVSDYHVEPVVETGSYENRVNDPRKTMLYFSIFVPYILLLQNVAGSGLEASGSSEGAILSSGATLGKSL